MSSDYSYIYNAEFTIEDIHFFDFPPELDCPEDLSFLVRFQMNNDVLLEVTEDEHIDSLNCGGKVMKNVMFTMSDSQLKCDPNACITAYKIQCPVRIVSCGCYKIEMLNCKFKELKKDYDCKNKCSNSTTPTTDFIKELAIFTNCDGITTGSIHYILRLTCYGPRMSCDTNSNKNQRHFSVDDFGRIKGCIAKTEAAENDCINTCPKSDDQYDEYLAQINGNSLIVRVTKDNFVTRVYDSTCDDSKDQLTIRGCDQQIDFKFPNNFTCCQCKKKFGSCKCKGDSDLTDFQRRTSCSGNSYRNSKVLPVIRGNLKYPAKFENQSIGFDVQDHCTPIHVTDKYKMKPQTSRAVCMQADTEKFNYEPNGMRKMPNGIEVCKVGCEDDVDVFVWKICQKKTSKNGKKNEIVLEMRTPRGPKVEIPKKETREVQVIEDEFEDPKKVVKKENEAPAPAASKGGKAVAPKKAPIASKKAPENGKKQTPPSKPNPPAKKK